ncbi:hypothetical protein Ddye_001045 [Dipteronia dyeriana]|uniref:Uncharacterized protein n=1 Tax=Dipteronia dyeriana TaxID=168575 RepID=A0AAE0CT51_9ROSI|nr:hypothetical protein Ddye_001045 [Dipteronia dyeriana]
MEASVSIPHCLQSKDELTEFSVLSLAFGDGRPHCRKDPHPRPIQTSSSCADQETTGCTIKWFLPSMLYQTGFHDARASGQPKFAKRNGLFGISLVNTSHVPK